MPKSKTVSVRLDSNAKRRLEKAASLQKQSQGAFIEQAGDEAARRILLEWAVSRHRQGDASFSELAEDTGLAIEQIMRAMGDLDREAALKMFLASCQTVAETQGNPAFLAKAREAVNAVAAEE